MTYIRYIFRVLSPCYIFHSHKGLQRLSRNTSRYKVLRI
nr:MAG TPA: hypothetical protein [Crassvirales sp.]